MTSFDNRFRLGLLFALGSAISFGLSGPFAKALMTSGWSPTAAVTARLAGGALVMAIYASLVRPGWWGEALRHYRIVLPYGLFPIAGAQLCYYNAVEHLSVGVALLLEYTAPVLVVGWLWAVTRSRPEHRTLLGVALAVVGIMLVLNVFSGAHINTVGVIWGLAAAVCAACYFLMSARVADHSGGPGLSPVALAAGGLIIGAAAVAALGLTGVMPMVFGTDDVIVAGFTTSPVVPVLVLGVLSTAVAYTLGIKAVSLLQPSFAALVGLSEVLAAVLWAALLVGEALTVPQAIGGAVVLAGLALARPGDRGRTRQPRTPVAPVGGLATDHSGDPAEIESR
ncbi:EamA family transporter [[Mycobacterium] burgundiense]|jgi:drug/metabolite transporter (DMT)-like permease|uniref:EamA family transporter n=1 Tax=[Mycobacterium] burgundiense TaxID=3064286 RepID=A0ABN9NKR1_9MYCO|nr:DMT family transporter [Mycolicibacterium sp. MU0053]CAJ1508139.1 EamA family transporter [Mycolicibacterium sp. MU0053]